MIDPGTTYEKNGVSIVVHSISHGYVYMQRFPRGVEVQTRFDNLFRMPLDEFEEAVKGARVVDELH